MATFGGVAIFGSKVVMQAGVINPPAVQQNTYPGQNGTEELGMGLRGGYTLVSGCLGGSGPGGLAAAEAVFRSFYDDRAYTLVDTLGVSWDWVKLESFQPTGRVYRDPYGNCYRDYTAKFRHITF